MENVLLNEFANNFIFLNIFVFILLFILFINPIIYIFKELINFISDIILALFNPILYFILFSSGSLTYILYSLISARHYETMFLTYAFITIFLLIYNCVKTN
jgi:hypothetical protein